jgi:hypothetical protein
MLQPAGYLISACRSAHAAETLHVAAMADFRDHPNRGLCGLHTRIDPRSVRHGLREFQDDLEQPLGALEVLRGCC